MSGADGLDLLLQLSEERVGRAQLGPEIPDTAGSRRSGAVAVRRVPLLRTITTGLLLLLLLRVWVARGWVSIWVLAERLLCLLSIRLPCCRALPITPFDGEDRMAAVPTGHCGSQQ